MDRYAVHEAQRADLTIQLTEDGRQIWMQLRLGIRVDNWLAVLGAEDQMHQK
jgi:hypothetical protein